ncbi:hypothetical protein [Aminivibrio pyruvatiphilus]|uniref:hypothetical protein n=1 Tax=Aminivibrio pyruvatiphilus TaxID=1005740 RepID=UPI0010634F29|nr:hypothetical protein [Aminivibrio pyruvatiphilus]
MCFVLDTNSFHLLFNPKSSNHEDFKPLLKWLYNHDGTCLVIGGTRYRFEIRNMTKYLENLVELKRVRKLREISDDVVDAEETRLKGIVCCNDFDDAHIVALFCASGCLIFASQDRRADHFIKMKALYPKKHRPPRIYRNASHVALLCEENIANLTNVIH